MTGAFQINTLTTRHVPVRCLVGGSGPDLVFLHGAGGVATDDPFLNALARQFKVHAPLLPGYGDSDECGELRDMLDVTLHSLDVIDALKLTTPILCGHSMGGMIAAEMAAIAPNDFRRLVLVAPAGLWIDAHPVPDIFSLMPHEFPGMMFHNVELGTSMMARGMALDDPEWLKGFLVTNARQLGMAGKLLFPIPDRGLASRLYRIRAQTCLVWGQQDHLMPLAYAQAFQNGVSGARLHVIDQAGHMVIWEKTDEVIRAITDP